MSKTPARARQLRAISTPAERVLWRRLRDRRLDGAKFVRQHAIGPYIVDFCCRELLLVIELDGGGHDRKRSHDSNRDSYLVDRSYEVLRFWNNEVFDNLAGVLEAIVAALERRRCQNPHPRSLSLAGRGM